MQSKIAAVTISVHLCIERICQRFALLVILYNVRSLARIGVSNKLHKGDNFESTSRISTVMLVK